MKTNGMDKLQRAEFDKEAKPPGSNWCSHCGGRGCRIVVSSQNTATTIECQPCAGRGWVKS